MNMMNVLERDGVTDMDRPVKQHSKRIWSEMLSVLLVLPFLISCAGEPQPREIIPETPPVIEVSAPEIIPEPAPEVIVDETPELPEETVEILEPEPPEEAVPDYREELKEGFYKPVGPNELVRYLAEEILEGKLTVDIEGLKERFPLYDLTSSELVDAALDAASQNPQISLLLYPSLLTWEKTIGYHSYKSETELVERRKALEEKVIDLLAGIDLSTLSDYDKSLLVHDLVIENTAYDYEVFDLILENDEWTQESWNRMQEAGNAYGALILGKAVCGGYAQAYALLAKAVGLEVYYVEGMVEYGSEEIIHAWNRVKIEDEWLVVDTTWDDIETPNRYMWLNQPTSIAYTHREEFRDYIKTLENELVGVSPEHTWFFRNDFYATKETVMTVLGRHIESGKTSFDILTGPLTNREVEGIMKEFRTLYDDEVHMIYYEDKMIRYVRINE